jgi:hypothetical protein
VVEVYYIYSGDDDLLEGVLEAVATELVKWLAAEVVTKDAIASGLLVGSFEVKHGLRKLEYVVENEAPYSAIVEFGAPPHRPPYEAILEWVRIKKGERGEEAEKAAWRIVKKIEREGYEPRYYARDALRKFTKRVRYLRGRKV